MGARLISQIVIQALIRRTEAEGGFATVLHKGDSISGAILLSCPDSDHNSRLFERISDFADGYRIMPVQEALWGDEDAINRYIVRRRKADPDLWIIELDIPKGERLAAEVVCGN